MTAKTDPTRLGRWFDAYGASLVLYARQFVDASSAEDVVQDVFAKLAGQRQPIVEPKGWLFRAVRNAAISRLRRVGRRRTHERAGARRRGEMFESSVADLIDARSAELALESLPPEQREAVVLRIWADMTYKQIAEVTDRPVTTVYRQYRGALAAIRREMESSCKTKTT